MKLKDFFTLDFESLDGPVMENLENLQNKSEVILFINEKLTKSVWEVIRKKFDQESEEGIPGDVEPYQKEFIRGNLKDY